MSVFYTNVQVFGSRIAYRGIENGRRVRKKVPYYPSLYEKTQSPTKFTTIKGEYVAEIKPGNIKDCKEYTKRYEGVVNRTIYGNQRYEYAFISDTFPDEITWNINQIKVANLDIEVGSESGFPEPETAREPIISIAMKIDGKMFVYGCGEYDNDRADVVYVKCENEINLIESFLNKWVSDYPDIITGWYVRVFDIPYLVNRIRSLLGEKYSNLLSPWGFVPNRRIVDAGRERVVYSLSGIAIMDYIQLYEKFAPNGKSQPSYKLDFICNEELGKGKIDFDEHENLHTLYKRDYQKFIKYNINDVELVGWLDDKLKLIELAIRLAYNSKTNFEDAFAQVRMWDAIVYNKLKQKNIVVPPIKPNIKDPYSGAYVKPSVPGMYEWVVSFDLDSMYPMLMCQFNISPDTYIPPEEYTPEIHKFLSNNAVNVDSFLNEKIDTKPLMDMGVIVTPNCQFFSNKKKGFLPEILRGMYDGRKEFKKKMIQAKKKLEKETDEAKKAELENQISQYNGTQLALKVCLNSAYGALGNEYFRFYDTPQAAAVPASGQLAIRWIDKHINKFMGENFGTGGDYVVASDTDSMYVSMKKVVDALYKGDKSKIDDVVTFLDGVCEKTMAPFIAKSYDELAGYVNASENKMKMKREVITDKGIWAGTKRYILNVYDSEGVRYSSPKVKVVGLEVIRSSTPLACKKKLKEAIDIIINKDENSIIEFTEEFRKEFRKLPPDEIAFPRSVNSIAKYSGDNWTTLKHTPIHVAGSIAYNKLVNTLGLTGKYQMIKEGEKIKYIYLRTPNLARSEVISFLQGIPPEFNIEGSIDYNTQFEKSFVKPLKSILDSIGWKIEESATLMGFFT